jgi:hypothetical protein
MGEPCHADCGGEFLRTEHVYDVSSWRVHPCPHLSGIFFPPLSLCCVCDYISIH